MAHGAVVIGIGRASPSERASSGNSVKFVCVNSQRANSILVGGIASASLHQSISAPHTALIAAMSYILRRAVVNARPLSPLQCTRIVTPVVMQPIAYPARRNYAAHQAEESYDAFNER
jgi:hypothetical protein